MSCETPLKDYLKPLNHTEIKKEKETARTKIRARNLSISVDVPLLLDQATSSGIFSP